jgi:hypothetical protein
MELKTLRDKCLLFNKFMVEKGGIPLQLLEAYEKSSKLIESAYLEGKIKPLKAMSTDIDNQVLRYMPLTLAEELRILFKESLNIDYDVVDKARLKAIEKILKKGKISNPDEYELLLNRVDEIYLDNSKSNEVIEINKILVNYHTR